MVTLDNRNIMHKHPVNFNKKSSNKKEITNLNYDQYNFYSYIVRPFEFEQESFYFDDYVNKYLDFDSHIKVLTNRKSLMGSILFIKNKKIISYSSIPFKFIKVKNDFFYSKEKGVYKILIPTTYTKNINFFDFVIKEDKKNKEVLLYNRKNSIRLKNINDIKKFKLNELKKTEKIKHE